MLKHFEIISEETAKEVKEAVDDSYFFEKMKNGEFDEGDEEGDTLSGAEGDSED